MVDYSCSEFSCDLLEVQGQYYTLIFFIYFFFEQYV